MSRKARNLHSYLVRVLASSIASREGVVEAADDFGTLGAPDPTAAGMGPDVVARTPDGKIVIGEAKYGTAWRADTTTRALHNLRDWRYQGHEPSLLVLAASAGHAQDAAQAASRAGWLPEAVRLIEVSLPSEEALDEARVEVSPATEDEVSRLADELTDEQRQLIGSGVLIPVATEAWSSYADRVFIAIPKRLGLIERDAFADEVRRVVDDTIRHLHVQLTNADAHVSAWELHSMTNVDVSPQLLQWSVVPSERGGWDVRRAGAQRASAHFDTQAEAHRRAVEIATRHGGGEVITHTRTGRIRDSDTVPAADSDP
jgi:hypothetical protein